jgi:regulatory protein SWI5
MDYGSYGQQQIPAVDRRHASKTVPELRDFFNAKSAGLPQQARNAQQFPAYIQRSEQSFIPNGLPVPQQHYQYQSSPMWSQEELQGLYSASVASNSPATTIAPALSRSASESSDKNASLQSALYRMRQERNFSMMQREQATGHPRVMQPLSVQPEGISPKMNPYISCKINTYSSCESLTDIV